MTLILMGGGGHAKVVADVARSAGFSILGVLTPAGHDPAPDLVRLGADDWIDQITPGSDVQFHIAMGPTPGTRSREDLFERLQTRGLALPVIQASSAITSPTATAEAGTIIMHAAVVNASAAIGQNCIINTRAVVEHDSFIGDHTHVGPGALLCGGVHIGSSVLIGVGAVVLPGVRIVDDVTIGAGSVVTRSIDMPGTRWWGNPARKQR